MKLDKNKIELLNKHSRPICRRDFLALGLTTGSAMVLAPTLGGVLSSRAWGQEMPSQIPALNEAIPFFVIDCAGGASFSANFLVGKSGGPEDLLTSYDGLGWNPRTTTLDRRYGLPMAGDGVSGLLQGLNETIDVRAQPNLRFGSFLHSGDIDTSGNPFSALSLIAAGGFRGASITNPVSRRRSSSGGNSRLAKEIPDFRPTFIDKATDMGTSEGLGVLFENWPRAIKDSIGKTMARLSESQLKRVLSQPATESSSRLILNKYNEVPGRITAPASLDARVDPIFQQIYGISPQNDERDSMAVEASVTKAVLTKSSGPGVFTISGCDYHDNTVTSGDRKDREIGQTIGRIVEAASRLGTPVAFQVITDGANSPRVTGSRQWVSDSVEKNMSFFGYFNPVGQPQYRGSTNGQIGAFTDGQGADSSTLIASQRAMPAYAAFANYLSLIGKVENFELVAGKGFFENASQMDSLLIFESSGA